MKNVIGFAFALSLALPPAATAEVRPRAGSQDSRVTYATYQAGQVYKVHTRVRNVTLVELGDGETIRSIAIGDSEAFQVDKLEGANVFTVKPVIAGADTNLTVETNRRFYFLNISESSKVRPDWSIKINVPGGGGSSRRAETSIPRQTPMSYRIVSVTGGAEFAPSGISDDGRKTHFQIPAGAPMPSVFRVDAQGREYAVNASVNGTVVTVGGRSERWVLRYGDAYVCIEGQKGGAV